MAVPVDLGLEPAARRRAAVPSEPLAAAEQQLHVLRAAQVHVLAQQCLEERAGMTVLVEHQGAGGLHLPHRQLPPVPGVPVGAGEREREPGHPPLEPDLHGAGAEPVADGLQPGRIGAGGEPVGQRGEADPGGQRLPLGPFVPVHPRLDRIGEVAADLDEPAAHRGVPDVDVEHRHPALLLGEGELRAQARIGVPLARRPHQLELLGTADRHHLRTARAGSSVQVRGHHIGLALPGPEPDYRDAVGLRPVLDVLPELLPDRLEQRRGHDRLAPVIVEEVDHPACRLQLGDIAIQVNPVQAGDIQPDMPGHHVRGSHHRRVRRSRLITSHHDHPQHALLRSQDEPAVNSVRPEPRNSTVRGGASLGDSFRFGILGAGPIERQWQSFRRGSCHGQRRSARLSSHRTITIGRY